MALVSYEQLREIAGLTVNTDPTQHAEQLYAGSFTLKSDKWVDQHKNLDPQEKFTLWNLHIGTDEFANANPREYHRIREELHPLGRAAARKEYLDVLDSELDGLDYSEQETIIKNKARQLPEYAWNYLVEDMPVIQQAVDSKFTNRTLRNSVTTHDQIFDELDLRNLDTDVSWPAHTDDLMWAVDMGRADQVKVVNGRVSLPDPSHPEGYSPVFSSAPRSLLGVEQLKMNRVYVRPGAARRIQGAYEKAVQDRKREEDLLLTMDYNRTTDKGTPREFVANAIIDRDSRMPDGAILTLGQIQNVVESRAETYVSYEDLILDYTDLVEEVLGNTQRRIVDVSNGK